MSLSSPSSSSSNNSSHLNKNIHHTSPTAYAATLQSLTTNLVKHIDTLRRDLYSVSQSITYTQQQKLSTANQIQQLQTQLQQFDHSLHDLNQLKERLESSLVEADRTFQSIVTSSQRLLNQIQSDMQAVQTIKTQNHSTFKP